METAKSWKFLADTLGESSEDPQRFAPLRADDLVAACTLPGSDEGCLAQAQSGVVARYGYPEPWPAEGHGHCGDPFTLYRDANEALREVPGLPGLTAELRDANQGASPRYYDVG